MRGQRKEYLTNDDLPLLDELKNGSVSPVSHELGLKSHFASCSEHLVTVTNSFSVIGRSTDLNAVAMRTAVSFCHCQCTQMI